MNAFQQEICAVADTLNKIWHLHAETGDDAIISAADPELEVLEHVCHELAHALTLGIRLGPGLASRIGEGIRTILHNQPDGNEFAEDNELECHAIVQRVLRLLGFRVSSIDFYAAAEMQLNEHRNICMYWNKYRRSTQYEAAVQAVMAVLLEVACL